MALGAGETIRDGCAHVRAQLEPSNGRLEENLVDSEGVRVSPCTLPFHAKHFATRELRRFSL
jgi:hypothetical protein